MKKLIISTMTIAMMTAAPASAQLLGGSGGLGGGLGGSIGSTLGSDTIGRTTGTLAGNGGVTGSTRIDRSVDTRSGRVAADADSSSSANGSLIGAADLPNNAVAGSADGSASGSANGSANASLIGTDTIRSTTGQVVGTARNAALVRSLEALPEAAMVWRWVISASSPPRVARLQAPAECLPSHPACLSKIQKAGLSAMYSP